MDLRRRTFLKTAALAALASTLPSCRRQVDHLVPYLLPDDEIVPGVADWYASTCQECPAGCGILVRVREGRAKKLEGNPDHPLNRGKLCSKGQASLQALYNPDRLTQPLQRAGQRADGAYAPLSWEEALHRCAEGLHGRHSAPIMITRPVSGTLSWILVDFMQHMGGKLYQYAPDAELPLQAALQDSLGCDVSFHDQLATADYVLSFGAPFLEHWISPTAFGIAYGHMRQGRPTSRGRVIHIEPRLSLTAANADRWIPLRPGTEGLLAIGIGRVLLDRHKFVLAAQDEVQYRAFYGGTPLDDVARATEIPRDVIVRLAHEFGAARSPLALGGGPACAHTNGTLSLIAINGLNALAGRLGTELPRPYEQTVRIPWLTEQAIVELAEESNTRARAPLLLYDCNPLFTVAPSIPVANLFERSPLIVSFSSFLDESTSFADLVLPDRAALESWGDHVSETPFQVAGLIQPAVMPLYESRQVGDTILDLGRQLGIHSYRWSSFYDLLQDRWRIYLDGKPHEDTPDWFEQSWVTTLQQGGWWHGPSQELKPLSFKPSYRYEPAVFSGDPHDFPFMLYPYPSSAIGHGEGANRPWLQELPDPMTGVVWGSWIEINPTTAGSLGIRHGDLVRVISSVGSLEVLAVLFPGMHPEVVAMPLGQGHRNYGRYAARRGVNPLTLLAPSLDSITGTIASGATRVRIERTGVKGRLVTLEQPAMDHAELITITKR